MKKQRVKIFAAIIAILLAVLMVLPLVLDVVLYSSASAASTVSGLNEKLDDLEKEKKEIQKELNRLKGEKSTSTAKKKALDREISVMQQEINTVSSLITTLDSQINTYAAELAEIETKEKEQYEAYKMRVRVMEEEGSVSYISVLLAADSFSDLLTKVEVIRSIMTHDRSLMDKLKATRADVQEKKAKIEKSRAEQASAKAKLVSSQDVLEKKSAQVEEVIEELTDEEKKYKREFEAAEKEMQSAKAELKKLMNKSSSKQTKYVGGTFMWPTPSCTIITSYYGMRYDPISHKRSKHTGIDIGARKGANIVAANSGTVTVTGNQPKGYGIYVVVDHGGGMSTLYAHMSKRLVSKGQKVAKGDVIGLVGSTGWSTGPHLHFEILKNGDDTNPLNYFTKS